MVSYWIDTLVLKNREKYLRYFVASPFPLQGKTNASAQEVARRISGAVAGEIRAKSSQDLTPDNEPFLAPLPRSLRTSQDIPSTHHKLLSLALHYLPFASRFPLPHFTRAVLFAISFPFASFLLASCLLVCWIACLSRWLKITLNCVTLPIPTTMIFLALRFLLLPKLNLVKLMPLC